MSSSFGIGRALDGIYDTFLRVTESEAQEAVRVQMKELATTCVSFARLFTICNVALGALSLLTCSSIAGVSFCIAATALGCFVTEDAVTFFSNLEKLAADAALITKQVSSDTQQTAYNILVKEGGKGTYIIKPILEIDFRYRFCIF